VEDAGVKYMVETGKVNKDFEELRLTIAGQSAYLSIEMNKYLNDVKKGLADYIQGFYEVLRKEAKKMDEQTYQKVFEAAKRMIESEIKMPGECVDKDAAKKGAEQIVNIYMQRAKEKMKE
jgi:hypothetical protein